MSKSVQDFRDAATTRIAATSDKNIKFQMQVLARTTLRVAKSNGAEQVTKKHMAIAFNQMGQAERKTAFSKDVQIRRAQQLRATQKTEAFHLLDAIFDR